MVAKRLFATAPIVAAALAGCSSVFAPMPKASDPVFFRSAAQPASAAGSAVAALCGTAGGDNCYYRGMGEMLEGVERSRLAYLELARASVNDTALYNALLYPAGATVLYRRLRGMPHSGLLFPASVAAAWYGVLNVGVPEIHKHYLRAAHELQCAELRHAEWLYRSDEILSPKPPPTPDLALEGLAKKLTEDVTKFAAARAALPGELEVPRAPAGPKDAFERARGKGGGVVKKDTRDAILQRSGEQIAIAHATIERLRALQRQIDLAPWRLQQEWNDIELDVATGISNRAPAALDPAVVGKELQSRLAKAQAGDGIDRMDPVLPFDLRDGVRDPNAKLNNLEITGQTLQDSWLAARRFLAEHQQRTAQAARDVDALRCKQRSDAVPLPAAKPAAGGASQPTGSGIESLPKGAA